LEVNGNYPSLKRLTLVANSISVLDFGKLALPSLEVLDLRKPSRDVENNFIRVVQLGQAS